MQQVLDSYLIMEICAKILKSQQYFHYEVQLYNQTNAAG